MSGPRERLTYVGHATVLIEIGGLRVLTDPVLRDRFLVIRRHGQRPDPAVARDIDAVLISHLHADHLDYPSLRGLAPGAELIVPAGAARVLERRGFSGALELSAGDSAGLGAVEVRATRATHDARRWSAGRAVEALGYVLRSPRGSIYFAGDTDLFSEMEALAGTIDVALLPIGGWGPTVGEGHLDPVRAAEAAAIIAPRVVVPIHWGTFLRVDLRRRDPGLLTRYPAELAREMAARAPGVELQVLEPGASLALE